MDAQLSLQQECVSKQMLVLFFAKQNQRNLLLPNVADNLTLRSYVPRFVSGYLY